MGSARSVTEVCRPVGYDRALGNGAKQSGKAMLSALSAIQTALEAEGIEFTEEDGVLGVKLKPKPKGKTKGK